MIERLNIKNYAIIEAIELDFYNGFHVFTGETGAGKSIIVGALGLILGARGDTSTVRTGADKALIEAEFSVTNEYSLRRLKELGVEDPSNLIIRREVSSNGKSRAFVNGFQEPISRLVEIGEWLIDIHGQHDHQLLLKQKVHIDILDSYGDIFNDRDSVSQAYKQLQKIIKVKQELETDEKKLSEEKIFWETAVSDIEKAGLTDGEEESLKASMERMEHAEKIKEALSSVYTKLYNDELAASGRITRSMDDLSAIQDIDPRFKELLDILEDASAKIAESVSLASAYLDEFDIDVTSVDDVTDRLSLIKEFKRKYNKNSIEDLLEYAAECKNKLNRFENRAEELEKIDGEIEMLKENLISLSMELSRKRQESALKMADKVKQELSFLGMDKADFIVDIKYVKDENSLIVIQDKPIKISDTGIDRVEFLISANIGQEAKPLQKVASGGEISRVMLALKSILADNDSIDTLIFDEIDVGIGGITANNVAEKMREISSKKQLMVITHLPQIASKCNTHFKVSKTVSEGATHTLVNRLTAEERIEEVARMLGGESDLTVAHAKEMLGG